MNISVTAAGMVTPVGFTFATSCAAMRAGISGIRQSNLWDPESGEHILAGKVDLPHWWEGIGKLSDLIAPAIRECFIAAKEPFKIPILLGVADANRPFRVSGLDELLNEIEFRLDLPHHPLSKIIPHSHVAGVLGLNEASALLAAKLAPACVVAGVDSFLQQNVVEAYLEQRRIMTPLNSNGFVPGEAGAAVMVEPGSPSWPTELRILGTGLAREESTIASDRPLRGEGITRAARGALLDAGLDIHDTSYRITDLSGEHYKFKEAAFVAGRFLRRPLPKLYDLWHPIEFIGETGAANVPISLALAFHAGQKQYANGPRTLMHFGNDDGERAAAVTEYVTRV